MKQLFIGSEGTLGIITKLSLLTPSLPPSVNVLFLGVNSFEEVLLVKQLAGQHMNDIISAVEFLDRGALEFPLTHVAGARDPLDQSYPFYALIETSGFNAKHDQEKVHSFLEAATEQV